MIDFLSVFTFDPKDSTAFWTMVVAVATISLVAIAWFQLGKMSKVARADFVHRFKIDFFKKETRELLDLFDNEIMTFVDETFSNDLNAVYFRSHSNHPNENRPRTIIGEQDAVISCSEIDDLLLGHFEDMGLFHRQGLMDIESIYEGFDSHIENIHDNEQILKYIEWKRSQPNGEDIYDGFDHIYKEVKKYGKRKERKLKIKNSIKKLWSTLLSFLHI